MRNHEFWMELAIAEARMALLEDEIPVGAVLVHNDELVYAEHNRTIQLCDPLAHAEKLIIDKILASKIKFLYEYSLYVTLEPCLMCSGMIIWSRLGSVVYGASDPKAGAAGSIYNTLQDKHFNHQPKLIRGILADECSKMLKEFFQSKRKPSTESCQSG